MNRIQFCDDRKTPVHEFAGIRYGYNVARNANHQRAQLCFEYIRRGQTDFRINPIRSKKQTVCIQVAQCLLRMRPYNRESGASQKAAQHDDSNMRKIREFQCDI